jgi:hypothetical protein
MIGAPEKIWAIPAIGGGWGDDMGMWRKSSTGIAGQAEYRRTDLTPPAADYVAGLFEIAPSIGAPTAEPTLRQVLMAYYKPWFGDDKIKELTQRYIDALAARPASPDTRIVTVAQLKLWVYAVEGWTHENDNTRNDMIAIIIGGQDQCK